MELEFKALQRKNLKFQNKKMVVELLVDLHWQRVANDKNL